MDISTISSDYILNRIGIVLVLGGMVSNPSSAISQCVLPIMDTQLQ